MDERKFNYQFYRLAPGRRLAIALDLGLVDYEMCKRIPLAFFSDIVQVARETDKIEALVKAVERANLGVQPTADHASNDQSSSTAVDSASGGG